MFPYDSVKSFLDDPSKSFDLSVSVVFFLKLWMMVHPHSFH